MHVEGDIIVHDGYRVARISTALPATVRDRCNEIFENAVQPDRVTEGCLSDRELREVLSEATKIAQCGMIEITELAAIIEKIREEDK